MSRRYYIRRTPTREQLERASKERQYERLCMKERSTISRRILSKMEKVFDDQLKKLRKEPSHFIPFFRSCRYLVKQMDQSFWIQTHYGLATLFWERASEELLGLILETLSIPKLLPRALRRSLKAFVEELQAVEACFQQIPDFWEYLKGGTSLNELERRQSSG